MDFNITLGVSQEELAEFPDSQEPTGIVVPTSQNSLQTTSFTEENTPEEKTIEERSPSLTTESSSQESTPPTPGDHSRHSPSPFRHSFHDPCRNRERQNGRIRQRRQRWQRGEGTHRSQETSHRSRGIVTNASSRTNGTHQQSCPDPEVLANWWTRRRRWRRFRSRLLRQLEFRRGAQSQGTKILCKEKKEDEAGYQKDKPPTFKGEPGERPEAHLLRALDWFDAIGIVTDKDMLRNFRHTLDGNAREWFADLLDKEKRTLTWDELTNSFSQYFSTQGHSLTHLHNAWKSFTFEP